MKYRRPKTWYVILRMIVLSFIVLSFNNEKIINITLASAENDNLTKMVEFQVIEDSQKELFHSDLYEPINSFTGELTGYAGDCPLCSGVVACKRINVLKEGIYYEDKEYGKVNMVASSRNYPCGTILSFKVNKLSNEPIIAIVLDRGVSGNTIDLLAETQDYARKKVGRVRNLEFDILRMGWER